MRLKPSDSPDAGQSADGDGETFVLPATIVLFTEMVGPRKSVFSAAPLKTREVTLFATIVLLAIAALPPKTVPGGMGASGGGPTWIALPLTAVLRVNVDAETVSV